MKKTASISPPTLHIQKMKEAQPLLMPLMLWKKFRFSSTLTPVKRRFKKTARTFPPSFSSLSTSKIIYSFSIRVSSFKNTIKSPFFSSSLYYSGAGIYIYIHISLPKVGNHRINSRGDMFLMSCSCKSCSEKNGGKIT